LEAYSAVEASLTGHTVVSTVHAGASDAAHMRIALLCQKRFPIDFNISMIQAGQAFPLIVYTHRLENNSRKVMDISECVIKPNGERFYQSLYGYQIEKNILRDNRFEIEGRFCKPHRMSDSLYQRLTNFGAPQDVLRKFLSEGEEPY
jgi:pilus assembly protein CpaF